MEHVLHALTLVFGHISCKSSTILVFCCCSAVVWGPSLASIHMTVQSLHGKKKKKNLLSPVFAVTDKLSIGSIGVGLFGRID